MDTAKRPLDLNKMKPKVNKDSGVIFAYQDPKGSVSTVKFNSMKQAKVFQAWLNTIFGSRQQTKIIHLDDDEN